MAARRANSASGPEDQLFRGGFVDINRPDPPATPDARAFGHDAERRLRRSRWRWGRQEPGELQGTSTKSPAVGGDDDTPLPSVSMILGKPTPPAGSSLLVRPPGPAGYLFGRKRTAGHRGRGGGNNSPAMNVTPLPSSADLMNLNPSDHSSGAAPGPNILTAGQDYVVGLFKSTGASDKGNGQRQGNGVEARVGVETNEDRSHTVSNYSILKTKHSLSPTSPICDRAGNTEPLSRTKKGQIGELTSSCFGSDDRFDEDESIYSCCGWARQGYLATRLSLYCGSRRRALAIAGLVLMFVVVVVTSVGGGNKGAQKASATGSSDHGVRGGYGSGLPVVPEEGEQVHYDGDTDQTLGRTTVNEAIDNSDNVDQPLRGTTDNEALDNSEEESDQTGVPSVNENGDCNDDPDFKFYDAATVMTNCADYVGRLDRSVMQGVLEQRCNLPQGTDHLVSQYCRKSCGKCSLDQGQATSPQTEDAVGPTQSTDVNAMVSSHSGDQITSTAVGCADDPTFVFYHDGTPTDCNTFVANVPKSSLLEDRCGVNFINEDGLMTKLSQSCRKSCQVCT